MLHNQILVHRFLKKSAEVLRDKIAVIHEGARLRYSQVNNHANQIANYLLKRGIRKEGRIAILLDNSLDSIVSYYNRPNHKKTFESSLRI